MDKRLLDILVCPVTKGPLIYNKERQELVSKSAGLAYPIQDGIPVCTAANQQQYLTIAPDDNQARVQVEFTLGVLKQKNVAVLHDKGVYGKGLAEFAKGFLEKDPRAEVVLYEGITTGAVDYSAVVQKIKRSGAEAVIFGGYHPEASKIISMMKKKT